MTIQQLQYVLEISRTGSVSKAAKTLYLSQPNLSNAIKNLENELGITIFERTPMGMQLTASGMKLAKKATSIMADIQEITSGISAEEDCLFRLVYPRCLPSRHSGICAPITRRWRIFIFPVISATVRNRWRRSTETSVTW